MKVEGTCPLVSCPVHDPIAGVASMAAPGLVFLHPALSWHRRPSRSQGSLNTQFDHQHSTQTKVKQHHMCHILFIIHLVPLVLGKIICIQEKL